jgi:drug/metabolite transporter (DMT)-like permease
MTLFYFSIALAICSSALYHFSQKQIPAGVDPIVSVIVTYTVSLILCFVLLYFLPPKQGLLQAARQLNWASYVLALSLVGLEVGFLLVYRAGWNIGLAAVLVNVVASLILIPLALLVFKDRPSWVNILGIVVCLGGLVMLNWQR